MGKKVHPKSRLRIEVTRVPGYRLRPYLHSLRRSSLLPCFRQSQKQSPTSSADSLSRRRKERQSLPRSRLQRQSSQPQQMRTGMKRKRRKSGYTTRSSFPLDGMANLFRIGSTNCMVLGLNIGVKFARTMCTWEGEHPKRIASTAPVLTDASTGRISIVISRNLDMLSGCVLSGFRIRNTSTKLHALRML